MRRDLVEQRRASVPEIAYPDQLPIVERRRELLDTIRENQVVVIAGETGSGKSTRYRSSVSSSGGASAP